MRRIQSPGQTETAFEKQRVPLIIRPDPTRIYSRRAARLRKLSAGAKGFADYLRLMAAVADVQQQVLSSEVGETAPQSEERVRLAKEHGMPPLLATEFPRDPSWHTVLHNLCGAVSSLTGYPEGVAKACQDILSWPTQKLEQQADLLLGVAAEGQIDACAAPFLMAALQVYWTRMVTGMTLDGQDLYLATRDVAGVCPLCGTPPVASIVKAEPPSEGYRYLHCGLCASEWHHVRIKCTHCEETEGIFYHSLQGLGAPKAVMAEMCPACRNYRKICYQDKDWEVEPLADDLATLTLDYMVSAEGYHRTRPNPLLWQES